MNTYLLQWISKWVTIFVMSIASMFGTFSLQEEVKTINNSDKDKSLNVVSTIVKYDTIVKYNSKVPSNVTKVLQKGENGIVYQDESGTTIQTLKEKIDKIVEVGTGRYGEYKGTLTLYGADCATCDGSGIVYCPIASNKWHSLTKDGIYYNDKQYGKVRILAADHRAFPCGTIIEINNSDLTKTIGIVLDTGSGMINAYNNGNIVIDLANTSEANLTHGTNKNTNFSVKRWGW